jgi:hypothetical protein
MMHGTVNMKKKIPEDSWLELPFVAVKYREFEN